jgi:hypothetical protein
MPNLDKVLNSLFISSFPFRTPWILYLSPKIFTPNFSKSSILIKSLTHLIFSFSKFKAYFYKFRFVSHYKTVLSFISWVSSNNSMQCFKVLIGSFLYFKKWPYSLAIEILFSGRLLLNSWANYSQFGWNFKNILESYCPDAKVNSI